MVMGSTMKAFGRLVVHAVYKFTQAEEWEVCCQHVVPHQDETAVFKPSICFSCVRLDRKDACNSEIGRLKISFFI